MRLSGDNQSRHWIRNCLDTIAVPDSDSPRVAPVSTAAAPDRPFMDSIDVRVLYGTNEQLALVQEEIDGPSSVINLCMAEGVREPA